MIPGERPTSEDLLKRIEALEKRELDVKDLPLAGLRRWLEANYTVPTESLEKLFIEGKGGKNWRVHGPYRFSWSHVAGGGGFVDINTAPLGTEWTVVGGVALGSGWESWSYRALSSTTVRISLVNQAAAAGSGDFYFFVISRD